MKAIDVKRAIELAREQKSLEGIAIKDLELTQVKAVDAIALADSGILIPEQNIIYRDEDVKYDPEFDDYEWTQLPANTSLEDLQKIAEEKKQPIHKPDEDIAYDEEIDELVIGKEITGMSWEEKAKRFEQKAKPTDTEDNAITISINFKDRETSEWAKNNYGKISGIVESVIEGLYKTYRLIK